MPWPKWTTSGEVCIYNEYMTLRLDPLATLPCVLFSQVLVGTRGIIPTWHIDIAELAILFRRRVEDDVLGGMYTNRHFQIGILGTQVCFEPLPIVNTRL